MSLSALNSWILWIPLFLLSCDANQNVGVFGRGASQTTAQTDEFTQTHATQVDILWVIDNSASMNEEQAAISTNASLFTDKLLAASVDFHLMMISTNASADAELTNNCLVSGAPAPFLTNVTADSFASCAQTSIPGGGPEEGIEASVRAINPNYVNGALNPNFLRSDADLEIVYVSDEEDQPDPASWAAAADITPALRQSLMSEMTQNLADGGRLRDGREAYFPLIQNHIDFFRNLKGPDRRFRAHAIVLPTIDGSGCHSRTNGEEAGLRYKNLAVMTGGTVSDICEDWSSTMDSLGLQASGLRRCFQLSHVPHSNASITVSIDGVVQDTGYTLTPPDQICFDTIPRVDSTISITYAF